MKGIAFLLAATMLAAPAAAAPVATSTAKPMAATEKQLMEAAAALQKLDADRLFTDKAYAESILLHSERLAPEAQAVPEMREQIAGIRALALQALGRGGEALQIGLAAIEAGASGPYLYGLTILAAAEADDMAASLVLYERAAKLPEPVRAELRPMVDEDAVSWLWQRLGRDKNEAAKQRFAEALLALGWPEPEDFAQRDWYRSLAIERRLAAGDVESARQAAAAIIDPAAVIKLVVSRKFDAVLPAATPLDLVRQSLARYDRVTRERFEAAPRDVKRLLERGQALRALGRNEDAVALLLPLASDLGKVEAAGEWALWVVNEAASALGDLGRHDEAVALMEKLLTLDVNKHPDLVNMAINHGLVLSEAGRYKQAAEHEAKLAALDKFASPYGYMWIWSMAACASAMGGDSAGTARWLEKLAANYSDNQSAYMHGLLCANDLDAAEKLLLKRIEGEDQAEVLKSLQTYEVGPLQSPLAKLKKERFAKLRERPAVRAAAARFGRILSLPLPEAFWADY